MAITIDFEPDQRSLAEARALDPVQQSGFDLLWSLFVMPVTSIVEEVTFLEGTRLEVLRLACDGLDRLRVLPDAGRNNLTFMRGGGLQFQMDGSDVIIESMGMGFNARAGYLELLESWERFLKSSACFPAGPVSRFGRTSAIGRVVSHGTLIGYFNYSHMVQSGPPKPNTN